MDAGDEQGESLLLPSGKLLESLAEFLLEPDGAHAGADLVAGKRSLAGRNRQS